MNALDEMYRIKQAGPKWEVYNPANGHVFGSHNSREEAIAQQKALYVNAPPDKEKLSEEDELGAYMDGLAESVPKDAPESDFADPPRGLYVGDAKHARLAVQAVTTGFRGNKAKARHDTGVKSKVAAAIRKFYAGDEQKYYLTWLRTGKKPDKVGETIKEMISLNAPVWSFAEEPAMPEVPLCEGIDYQMLVQGDVNPQFVTRPLAIVESVSDNGLKYDDSLLQEIEQQVKAKRPPARLGHVPEEQRGSLFPPDQGTWVGVLRQGDTLFGKCYIHPGTPLADMIRVRRAVKGRISNSIWGNSALADNPDGTVRSLGLELESIDFVPPERAANKALGGEFGVTSEMEGESDMAEHSDAAADLELLKRAIASIKPEDVTEEMRHSMTAAHLKECDTGKVYEMLHEAHRRGVAENFLKETTPEEVYEMLSPLHRKHVAEAHLKEIGQTMSETKSVAEMTAKLAEMTKMQQQVAEMQTIIQGYQRQDFERALDTKVDSFFSGWQVRTVDGQQKLNSLKANLRVLTVAEMAGSTRSEDIGPAAEKAWTNVKPLAELTQAALAGPSAFVGPNGGRTASVGYDSNTGRYDEAQAKAARAKLNL